MFLGLLDPDSDQLFRVMVPDSDPLVRGMDPDPAPDSSIICKNSKKNLDSYSFFDFFLTFYL
jgi:hypothetical protein